MKKPDSLKIGLHKIGGSSLRNLADMQACTALIKTQAKTNTCIFVFSALYGVTNQLQEAISLAQSGGDYDSIWGALKRQHTQLLHEILDQIPGQPENPVADQLDRLLIEIKRMLEGASLSGDATNRTVARVLGAGERMSTLLIHTMLHNEGADSRLLNWDELLVANGDPLDGFVDAQASQARLQQSLANNTAKIIIVPGFVATDADGRFMTLGRNGSDYSAACLAVAAAADRCIIWKDVDGVFSADPALVANAHLLPQISYREVLELSYFGAKVINARAVGPLMAASIPCEIRNIHSPEKPGTLISEETDQSIKGISYLADISLIYIAGPGLRGTIGIAQRMFQTLAAAGISIIQIVQSSSEFSISLAVRDDQVGAALAALNHEFRFELLHQQISQITSLQGQAIISLVGDGMKHRRGVAARLLSAVAATSINIAAIAQGPSERAIALVVDVTEAPLAIKACHDEFFADLHYLDVVLIGCGLVGSELLQQIEKQQDMLTGQNIHIRVRAICNSKSMLLSEYTAAREIELSDWQTQLETKGVAYDWDAVIGVKQQMRLINPTIIDCTANKEVAEQYVKFLDAGFNVVAANKHANTLSQAYYQQLRKTGQQRFRKFLYETNVGAGLPVIDTVQSLIRSGDSLRKFNGILSGSLSLIFGLLDDGNSFSEAVGIARKKGFTEPDPREDLSGMDVARKLLIIARETGMQIELDDILVEPVIPGGFGGDCTADELAISLRELDAGFSTRVAAAAKRGQVLRYVGQIDEGHCIVNIAEVDADDPLSPVRDGENALAFYTDYYSPIPMVMRGYGAGATVTAAGVFGDVLRTLRQPALR
ncbi:MAG: bifunctional aspartate kinase/homoserine dehydrogenase I [Xanthomonadales bacterium]|nr:bifunctional aspartate kinase/homoserine dehydrogenase I [Xanthomonadales bacterium]